jgi:hypothetical protein
MNTPTPVAHSRLLPSQQQTKNAKAESHSIAAFRRTATHSSAVGFALRGDFRRQQSEVLLRSCNVSVDVSNVRQRRAVNVSANDAAQPCDHESTRPPELEKLKVGIIGFGNFGQFLAERMLQQGHQVLAHSRRDYSDEARKLGVAYFRSVGHKTILNQRHSLHEFASRSTTTSEFMPIDLERVRSTAPLAVALCDRDADDFCEEHPEVVLLCTSILSTELVLQSLPLQRLKRNTLFVDVLSVKEFPKNLFLQVSRHSRSRIDHGHLQAVLVANRLM